MKKVTFSDVVYKVQGTVVHGVQGTLELVRGTGYCCCKDTLQDIYRLLVKKNIAILPCKKIALWPYCALLHDVMYPKTYLYGFHHVFVLEKTIDHVLKVPTNSPELFKQFQAKSLANT
ncbi:hypothetical protein C8F04DRAFT_1198148 [Mycena alexandri]|uniref:Uncharacterized protein n=1 Tax=Mycena alexandri TaxID=1745969 RepID=A0AAD6S2B6_9AGAR|nr:hypothetical protein C8F04DRAFT_1198148 [Mycena alexandri]